MGRVDDASWVRGMFGYAPRVDPRTSELDRVYSSAEHKFADTSLGGNEVINPLPQLTRFADLKATGLLSKPDMLNPDKIGTMYHDEENSGSYRLGRWYSEKVNDNQHAIHMRFGVPKYTGTIAFFANMYDRDLARLARTGCYSTVMRTAGTAAGLYGMFTIFGAAVMVPLIIGSQLMRAALSMKPSRYYYMKPTQNLYLQAVQAMVDTQLMHHRLVPMYDFIGSDRYVDVTEGKHKLNKTMQEMYKALPDIWKSNGKFDVFRMVNRYQVLANYQAKTLQKIYDKSSNQEEYNANVQKYLDLAKNTNMMRDAVSPHNMSMQNLSKLYADNPAYQVDEKTEKAEAAAFSAIEERLQSKEGVSGANIVAEQEGGQAATEQTGSAGVDPNQTNEDFFKGILDWAKDGGQDVWTQFQSEMKDGADWVSFRVNAKDTKSDSFSNTTKEPTISSTINGISSKARSINASTSGGKTGFDFVDQAISGVKEFTGGVIDSLHLTGLAAIYGSSIVDFPEVYESSLAQLAPESYTIPLRSPFGNDISLFQNITVPLCFLLAGALPLATGKQTYTSPFLVELHSRGRQTTRLGIIDSITITRGVGSAGWRPDGRMLGADVTITVKDLSKAMAMSVIKDPSVFDTDNLFTDYMATLGAASLREQVYESYKLTLNANKWIQSWRSRLMTGRITNDISYMNVSRVLSGLTSGTQRL